MVECSGLQQPIHKRQCDEGFGGLGFRGFGVKGFGDVVKISDTQNPKP